MDCIREFSYLEMGTQTETNQDLRRTVTTPGRSSGLKNSSLTLLETHQHLALSNTLLQSHFQNVHHRCCVCGTLAYISSIPKNHYRMLIPFFSRTHITISRFRYTQPSLQNAHNHFVFPVHPYAHQRSCVSSTFSYNSRTPTYMFLVHPAELPERPSMASCFQNVHQRFPSSQIHIQNSYIHVSSTPRRTIPERPSTFSVSH